MRSILTASESHGYVVSLQTLLAVVLAGIILLGVLASLTAPSIDRTCSSTPANRAVVQCAVHGN
jgi:hypothetical protein